MSTSLDEITEIKKILIILNEKIEEMNDKIEKMNDKLDVICNNNKLHEEVFSECKKMSSHIDFVESVYDNMKHPLNYLCGTINNISSNNIAICNEQS